MALSPLVQASQGFALVAADADGVQASQAYVMAAGIYPSEFTQASQAFVSSTVEYNVDVQVSQAFVLAAARGRVATPQLRAWTFSLDGHDFYVLRLGDKQTLVYDVYSEQWVDWADFGKNFWRANVGTTWIGGLTQAHEYGSNIVVGDDTFGLIWFLDPEQPYDQHPVAENPTQEIYFERIVMGQYPIRGREMMPCYSTWLTTNMGDPAYTGASVTLSTSDDAGQTFDDHGAVEITTGEFSPQLSWYSLGQIAAPGRLFKIQDDGAIARIDGFEMNDPDDAG